MLSQMRRKSISKPTAIITTLEDSVSWLDQRLVSAYLRTTYRCFLASAEVPAPARGEPESGVFDLRVGKTHPVFDHWLAGQGIRQYAFITAANPASQPLSEEENEHRNQALEGTLRHLVASVLPGISIGDEYWPPEAGFFALGISAEQAVGQGRLFSQNAIVFGQTGGIAALWWLPKP